MTKPAFVYVIYIQSTPEKVYAALQDPEMTKLYWGAAKNVSADWRPGSEWRHEDYATGQAQVIGTVVEAAPPNRLVLTWGRPGSAEPPSRVSFDVEAAYGAVKLTITQDELNPATEKMVTAGWPAILSSLKSLLETGKPLDATTRPWGR